MAIQCGFRVFSLLIVLTWRFQAKGLSPKTEKDGNPKLSRAQKNSTKASANPEGPKLPVPWQKLAANMASHAQYQKNIAAPKQNHTNKSHLAQHEAGVHSKKDELKFEADTEGVVVQPLPQDVAAKVETKLAAAAKPAALEPVDVSQSHTPSKPLDSSIDAMAVLHQEAELKLHTGKTQHETKKVKQQQNSSSINHHVKQQELPKHKKGLANFEKDMGVNSSAANYTEAPTKVASTSKRGHRGKHHKAKKAQSVNTPKPSANVTGDAMSMLHHDMARDDISNRPVLQCRVQNVLFPHPLCWGC
jgi:hypothetical protein